MPARQPFSPAATYRVRREFLFQGKSFKEGDKFPSRGVKINDRKMRQMYQAGRLTVAQ